MNAPHCSILSLARGWLRCQYSIPAGPLAISWTLSERRLLVRLWLGLVNGHPDAAAAAAGWHLMIMAD